jgi:hypothetical protein
MSVQEQIRQLFKSNLDISCYDIANILSVDVEYANKILREYFGNYHSIYDDLYLVESIDLKNIWYLFTSFGEKKLEIEDNYIVNTADISERERIWLHKNYNIKILWNKMEMI